MSRLSGQAAIPARLRAVLCVCSRFARRLVLLALLLLVLVRVAFHAAVVLWPYPQHLRAPPGDGAWIEDRGGAPLAALVAADGQWRLSLPQERISLHLLNAIVAIEDARFQHHGGVDWQAAAAAAWQNVSSMRYRRGASTITMQLHRLRDPRPRGLWAKFEQAVRAAQIERSSSKRDILVEYVNRAPFGGNLVGAGAASWRYFGLPCDQLSLAQAATLAGVPQSPSRYRPDRYPARARSRRDLVLSRMLACGMITQPQHDQARAEPLDASWRPLPQMHAGDGRTLAHGAMPSLLQVAGHHDGVLRTTLDLAMQRRAHAISVEQLAMLEPSGVTAACVVVLDTTSGHVLACVNLCAAQPTLDLSRCARSTGSALKPFIYAAAFEAAIASPTTPLRDSPASWPGYAPENYDHAFRGTLSAADALAESRNIPALHLLGRLGPERAAGVMGAAGLHALARRPSRFGLSLAIGGAEASPLELAQAYATLARGGTFRPASFIAAPPSGLPPKCLEPWACFQALHALSDSDRTARLCPEARNLGAAWKTGTSSGHRDAWCAAVTAHHTVVAWLGNPRGHGASCLVGADAAAPLALRVLAALDAGGTRWPDTAPPGVVAAMQPSPRVVVSVLWPSDGLEVIYNPDIPADGQSLRLRAGVTAGPDATAPRDALLWWFLDGQPLGSTRDDHSLYWPPRVGSHDLRVVDAQGRAARVAFRVR